MNWQSLIIELLNASVVRSSILVGISAVALWIFKVRHPATRHTVWTAVLAAMLLIPLLSVAGPRLYLQILPAQHPAVPNAAPEPEISRSVAHPSFEPVAAAPAGAPLPAAPAPVPGFLGNIRMDAVVSGLYLLGLTMMFVRRAAGWLLLRRVLSRSTPRFRGALRESPDVTAPVTVGVLSPVVLLPAGWDRWDVRTRRAVLAHEFAHVRRRDTWTLALAHFVGSVLWFHPLAWWLRRETAQLSELACDLVALRTIVSPTAYAELLLDWANAAKRAGYRVSPPGLSVAASAGLRRRIDQALAFSRSARRPRRVGLILSLAGLPAISLAAAVTLTEKPAVLSPASLEVLGPVLPVMPPSPIPPSPPAQPEEEQPAVIQRGADTQAVTGGVIAGTIKLANGAPAAEMRVTAIAVEHGGIVAGAFTDRNGRYRLEGLRVGSFYVSVGPIPASGYVLPTPPPATESLLTYYPGVPRQQDARPVKIAEGAIVEDLNFSIERPLFAVTGKIIPGFPGQQRPKAVFLLTLNGAMEARIADGGEFVFPNVLPGQYNLRPGSPIVGADRLITVNEDIRGLELTLPPAVYVAGRIVVERSANGFPGFQLTVSRGNDRYSIMRFPMGPNGNIGGGGGGGGTSDETRLMVDFNHQDNSLNSHLMSALPGEYRLSVEPLSPDFEVKSVTYAGVKVTGDTFTVASEDSEGLVITIAPKAGTGR